MPNLYIKEIPKQLLDQLRRRAAHRRHSINREVILCLGRATELPTLEPNRWVVDADHLRTRLDLPSLADQVLRPPAIRGLRHHGQACARWPHGATPVQSTPGQPGLPVAMVQRYVPAAVGPKRTVTSRHWPRPSA